MGNNFYWNRFIHTGKIDDYLHYACTSEEAYPGTDKENTIDGSMYEREGHFNGDGSYDISSGGL